MQCFFLGNLFSDTSVEKSEEEGADREAYEESSEGIGEGNRRDEVVKRDRSFAEMIVNGNIDKAMNLFNS